MVGVYFEHRGFWGLAIASCMGSEVSGKGGKRFCYADGSVEGVCGSGRDGHVPIEREREEANERIHALGRLCRNTCGR